MAVMSSLQQRRVCPADYRQMDAEQVAYNEQEIITSTDHRFVVERH
jgi:hypothetical protein